MTLPARIAHLLEAHQVLLNTLDRYAAGRAPHGARFGSLAEVVRVLSPKERAELAASMAPAGLLGKVMRSTRGPFQRPEGPPESPEDPPFQDEEMGS